MHDDLELLGDIERQLALYRQDMERGFELRIGAVEKVLADMETRGDRFFEDTLRIGRVTDLLNRARVQKEFEDKVVADTSVQIERRVAELIDWLVDQDFRQWQAITRKLAERQHEHASRVLGAPEVGSFHNDRAKLMESVGREAQRVVDTYDKRLEGEAIADQARIAVAAAAAAGGAAVGLGTIVTIAASTVAADITGILLASLVLGVGFLIIPARRRRAKALLQEKVGALRIPAGNGTENGVRAGTGTQRRSTDGRRRPLCPVCPRRRSALEGCAAYACDAPGAHRRLPRPAGSPGGRRLAAPEHPQARSRNLSPAPERALQSSGLPQTRLPERITRA